MKHGLRKSEIHYKTDHKWISCYPSLMILIQSLKLESCWCGSPKINSSTIIAVSMQRSISELVYCKHQAQVLIFNSFTILTCIESASITCWISEDKSPSWSRSHSIHYWHALRAGERVTLQSHSPELQTQRCALSLTIVQSEGYNKTSSSSSDDSDSIKENRSMRLPNPADPTCHTIHPKGDEKGTHFSVEITNNCATKLRQLLPVRSTTRYVFVGRNFVSQFWNFCHPHEINTVGCSRIGMGNKWEENPPPIFMTVDLNTDSDWKDARELILDILGMYSLSTVGIRIQKDRVLRCSSVHR